MPVFQTSNADFIAKCGLDAYFFLRFLRLLLKVFIPSAFIIVPILISINSDYTGGTSTSGLNRLGWQNYDPARTHRFWAHLILAVLLIIWFCYVVSDELQGYIKVRQAYLTSPQHRLRASATTVLVTSIPAKWLTREALLGLYDAFPGGIRNIWINRDFDELSDKVKLRNKVAKKLENAETELIVNAVQKYWDEQKKIDKKSKIKRSKAELKRMDERDDTEAMHQALQGGMSSGNPHQAHTIAEELGKGDGTSSISTSKEEEEETSDGPRFNIPVIGKGVVALSNGIQDVSQGFTKLGRKVMKSVRVPNTSRQADTVGGTSPALDFSGDPDKEDGGDLPEENPVLGSVAVSDMGPDHHARSGPSAPRDASPSTQTPEAMTRELQPSDATHLDVTPSRTSQSQDDMGISRSKSQRKHKPEKALDWTKNDFIEGREKHSGWKFWKTDTHGVNIPSPQPHHLGDSQFPFDADPKAAAATKKAAENINNNVASSRLVWLFTWWKSSDKNVSAPTEYPSAYDEAYVNDEAVKEDAAWEKYLKKGDRPTTRCPLFGLGFMPFLPSWLFIGTKVDTIYYCRKELARLNQEIEQDQKEPEKYPLMNSAFIQFNHQSAAHMACQCLSHHSPSRMSPRYVEIAPKDVIWDSLSIKWWERFLRIGLVFCIVLVLVVFWAVPVSVTAGISKLTVLGSYSGFHWVLRLPKWAASVIQGILPWLLLTILLNILPLILKLLAGLQGVPTGMEVQLSLQNYYFSFLFVQLFIVNTITSGLVTTIATISKNPSEAVTILAKNIPTASNYYFSYMLLQAFSTSASNIAQIVSIAVWFLWRPIADTTARDKFSRITSLNWINWGSFFPIYTVLACIGLIYAVIAPIIVFFNIITFSLFWFVFRYQNLYVNVPRGDTGGLMFPRAINQLFVGVYVMELALVGMFSLIRNDKKMATCLPQALIMLVAFALTILYQILLSVTYSPLYRYMPITLEDDAVDRDDAFQRMQELRWDAENGDDEDEKDDTVEERAAKSRSRSRSASRKRGRRFQNPMRELLGIDQQDGAGGTAAAGMSNNQEDIGEALYGRYTDQIQDLTGEERDILVQKAFQHSALRARRPVIWIPQDPLRISEDEIRRTSLLSADNVWISNDGAWIARNGKVMFTRAPPDFAEIDLVDL